MATAAEPKTIARPQAQRFLLRDVGWEGYQAMLKIVGDRPIRLTYDRGDLELMAPLSIHERYKSLFGRMIETLTEDLDIPVLSVGSMTMNREEVGRGLEPDECFYFADLDRLRDPDHIDLDVDPPPDLAVEIDIASSSLDRMGIYAALRVPEVWRFDGVTFEIRLIQPDGQYTGSPTSAAFPFLPIPGFVRFVQEPGTFDGTLWIRSFRAWVREVVLPLARG